jgi:WD40-like Beta Propeller Repeat
VRCSLRLGLLTRTRTTVVVPPELRRLVVGALSLLLALAALAVPGTAGSAGSDGLIVFVSTRGGPQSLYSVRPDGSRLVRFTRTTGARSPRVSPDGRHVVFDDANYDLRVLDVATGRVRPLIDAAGGPDPAVGFGWGNTRRPWSPDGRRFAVGSDDGLVIFGADGTDGHRITSGEDSDPTWSPDGRSVAFDHGASGPPPSPPDAIYSVGVDGRGLRLVVRDGDEPIWSPDGREIAFTRDVGIPGRNGVPTAFVVPASGGRATKIALGYPAWSPDGRALAVASPDGLAVYSRAGGLERALFKGDDVQDAVWSPDGSSVLAVVRGDLWLFARGGSTGRRVTQGELDGYVNSEPSWSSALPSVVSGTTVAIARAFGGPLVAISRATGRPVARFPRVSGVASDDENQSTVWSVVGDGRGGWYVGGDFASVGGVVCQNLVHVTGAGTVDRHWCPRPNGAIRGLVRIGTALYVAGENVTRISGASRRGLAAYDTRGGRLASWNPSVKGAIYDMAADPSGKTLYFAGLFDKVGETPRSNLAAVDVRSGAATTFAPNPDADAHGDSVGTFAVTETHVYAWGWYAHIGGQAATGETAQLDAQTGTLLS